MLAGVEGATAYRAGWVGSIQSPRDVGPVDVNPAQTSVIQHIRNVAEGYPPAAGKLQFVDTDDFLSCPVELDPQIRRNVARDVGRVGITSRDGEYKDVRSSNSDSQSVHRAGRRHRAA